MRYGRCPDRTRQVSYLLFLGGEIITAGKIDCKQIDLLLAFAGDILGLKKIAQRIG